MRSAAVFLVTLTVLIGAGAVARTLFGAELGQPCTEMLLSCRATRGIFTVNACVRTGPDDEDTFCSYACEATEDCPAGWTCDPAGTWSNVPGALEDVARACQRPAH